jgi:hypothetical protein
MEKYHQIRKPLFSRRDMLKTMSFGLLTAAVTPTLFSVSSTKAATRATGKAIVGIGRGADHAAVVAQAIENAGGLERIVSKGDTVIIKPNLSSSRGTLTYPGNTDYRVVAEVVRQVRALGAGRTIVAEGAGTGAPLSDPIIGLIRYNTYALMYGPASRVKVFFEITSRVQFMYPASFRGNSPVPMMQSALCVPITGSALKAGERCGFSHRRSDRFSSATLISHFLV